MFRNTGLSSSNTEIPEKMIESQDEADSMVKPTSKPPITELADFPCKIINISDTHIKGLVA